MEQNHVFGEVRTMRTVLLFSLLALHAQAVTLVGKGVSKYSIVLAAQASPSERRAASELQRYIGEMSGARLEIASDGAPVKGPMVLLGDNAQLRKLDPGIDFGKFGAEGFLLRTKGRHLIIAGGRQRGTMYGVYTLLDKLGCRWFTREVSRIPKLPTIEVGPLDETHQPAFENREPFFTEAWDKDWAARNRTNGDHTQLDESTGGKLKYYPFVHSFEALVPPSKYFKDHPEYFSLIDGKRRAERSQLCLTNPDVLRIAITQVESWIKEHPDTTIFSVSQNDWEGWCECDKCRRVEAEEGGRHSGPLLRFVNAVATEIGKRYPDKLIDTLAYWYTENPPLKVRPVPNVRIRLCPIGICIAHSFASCPRSAYFYKNLQAWSKITNQLYIWHYNTNFRHYPLPMPDFDELAADIPIYKNHGVVGLFMQGAYPPGGGGSDSELRAYVLARQLWDEKTDVSKTVDEFIEGVYGPAAKPMREYFNRLHAEVRPDANQHLWIFNVPDYSPAFLPRAQETFRQALGLAQDDATRQRVMKAKLPIDYYSLLLDSRYRLHGGIYAPAGLPGLQAKAKELFARMRSFGIESIHEGQKLDLDEKRYAEMKPLAAVTLENAQYRTDIVPDLNARALNLLDKRAAEARDLMREFLPGEGSYPGVGGLTATVHNDYYARAWDFRWTIESQTRDTVILAGQCDNGARLRRTFAITAEGLRTVTELTNAGSSPLPAALQVRAEFKPGEIDSAAMAFTTRGGEQIRQVLLDPNKEPTGKQTWTGAARPSGQWQLLQGGGLAISTRFNDAEAERCYFNWTAKANLGVAFGLWSKELTLAPGESVRIEASYGASPRQN
jgi:hypothetical protein